MALTKEDLQAISELLDKKLEPVREQQEIHTVTIDKILEQQEVHTRSIIQLENSVMHELKMLSENLPSAVARHEALEEVTAKVDDHDHRIFALEQVANK